MKVSTPPECNGVQMMTTAWLVQTESTTSSGRRVCGQSRRCFVCSGAALRELHFLEYPSCRGVVPGPVGARGSSSAGIMVACSGFTASHRSSLSRGTGPRSWSIQLWCQVNVLAGSWYRSSAAWSATGEADAQRADVPAVVPVGSVLPGSYAPYGGGLCVKTCVKLAADARS